MGPDSSHRRYRTATPARPARPVGAGDRWPTIAAVPADVDVSVVLPVYNESGHLAAEVERVRSSLGPSGYSYEVIVVDDGSTDGSATVAADLDVRLIELGVNRGVGAARRVGTKAARGRVVVWTDVDMTYPNDQVAALVDALEGYDQVVGARTHEAGTLRALRAPAKWVMARLAGYLVEQRIPDLNSGFRAFRRDVGARFLHRLPAGFSCVTTMTLSFLADGYSVRHVPIDYAPRAGRSKFHWRRDTLRYLTQIVRMVMTYNPLRVFMPLAVALLGLGAAKLTYDVVTDPVRLSANTLLILFAGLQLLAVGLLADLFVTTSRANGEEPARW